MGLLKLINNKTSSGNYSNSILDSYENFKNTFEDWFKGKDIAGNFSVPTSISSSVSTSLKNKIKSVFKEAITGGPSINLLGFDGDYTDELYGSAFLRINSGDDTSKIIPIIVTNYSYSQREKFYAPVTSYNGKNVLYLGENANEPILNIAFVIPENKEVNTYKLITEYYEKYNVSNSKDSPTIELLVNNTIYNGYWIDLALRANNEFSNLMFGQMTLLIDHVSTFNDVSSDEEEKKVKILIVDKAKKEAKQMPIVIRQVSFSEREAFQQLTGIYGTNNGFFAYGKMWPQVISISGLYPTKIVEFKDLKAFNLSDLEFIYTSKYIEELYEKASVNGNKDTYVYMVLLDKVYKGKFIAKSESSTEDMEIINSIGLNMLLLEKIDKSSFEKKNYNEGLNNAI